MIIDENTSGTLAYKVKSLNNDLGNIKLYTVTNIAFSFAANTSQSYFKTLAELGFPTSRPHCLLGFAHDGGKILQMLCLSNNQIGVWVPVTLTSATTYYVDIIAFYKK